MKSSEAIQGLQDVADLMLKYSSLSSSNMSDGVVVRLNAVIQEAKKCIAMCLPCRGRGTLFMTNRSRPGDYKARELRGGGMLYEYTCTFCDGKGQKLTSRCTSCLKDFDTTTRPRPTQLEMIFMDTMCDICFEARDAKTGLIPLAGMTEVGPSEETKKLEPAKNENPEPKRKGRK